MRMKRPASPAYPCLALLVLSCALASAAPRQGAKSAKSPDAKPARPPVERQVGFKAVTFNLRTSEADDSDAPKGNGWDARKGALLQQLQGTGAKLVGLQELSARQAADVRARFKSSHALLTSPRELGLLYDRSFFVLAGSGTMKLTGSDEWGDRYFLWARLKLKEGCGCVLAVNTHFSTEAASRLTNGSTVAEWLGAQKTDCAFLVLGDLNEPEGPVTDRIRAVAAPGQGWTAAAPGIGTFNDFAGPPGKPLDPALKLDHILARSPGLRVVSGKVYGSHPDRNAYSDHYALEALLALTAEDCRKPTPKK